MLLLLTVAFIYREVQQVKELARIEHQLQDLAMQMDTDSMELLTQMDQ